MLKICLIVDFELASLGVGPKQPRSILLLSYRITSYENEVVGEMFL
jgi:hypothetical protein